MKTIEQIAAEILVDIQYKDAVGTCLNASDRWSIEFGGSGCLPVDPFADTLEGRRQADAIEDWLAQEHTAMWMISEDLHPDNSSHHQWRLERIKWCLEQLRDEE